MYVHKDAFCNKAQNYMRCVPLCQDGVFWCALWEVMVDRSDRIDRSRQNTDQWIQTERSVHLVALWLGGCRYEDMKPGWEVTEAWDPVMEANPHCLHSQSTSSSSSCSLNAMGGGKTPPR